MVQFHDNNLTRWRMALSGALLLAIGLLWPASQLSAATDERSAEQITDLRILVDVSGSMKRNDPKNLRRDALRLLIGLLPENSRAGIWSFGQYVNMQVKPDFATKSWKSNARKEANTIHSRGLYTNIEDTLTKSSWDWRRPDPKWDRHMILLTDGMVDISKDATKNKKSRQNILNKILNELSNANVKIHTIALSKQADHDLLENLATKTGGWYESVNSADKLQRLFLRLFEKTSKMDSLPLEENNFDVDNSISDMTLLVFRSQSGKQTRVILPDQSVLEYGKTPVGVEWFRDNDFDIISIHKPKVGKWKLDADIDKDNRVKVITNLKLKVDSLPTDIIQNEAVNLNAALFTKEGLLTDKKILGLVELTADNRTNQGSSIQQSIPAAAETGKFKTTIDGTAQEGTLEIIVKATSPTFKRESRHEIKVHKNPVSLELSATPQGLVISVTENPDILQTGTLQLALKIEGNEGAYYIPKLGAHHWQAKIDNAFSGKKISISASANRIGNTAYRTQLHGRLPEAIIPIKDPLTIWSEEAESGLVIKAILEGDDIQVGTLQLEYFPESNEPGEQQGVVITQQGTNLWQQLLLPEHAGTTLTVKAVGHQLDGREFKKTYQVTVPELTVEEEIPKPEAEIPVEPEIVKTEEPPVEESDADKQTGDTEDKADSSSDGSINLTILIVVMVIGNIFIFGGGYLGYRYWRSKNQPLTDDFDNDTDSSSGSATEPTPETKQTSPEAVVNESEPFVESDVPGVSGEDNEDFSDQRKAQTIPENVDLDVEENETEQNQEQANLIDTDSADDLPDFDIDIDSDLGTDEGSDAAVDSESVEEKDAVIDLAVNDDIKEESIQEKKDE